MTEELVISLGKDALYTVLLVSAPILGLSLLVGLVVSIFQATTQIQEQTLAFVPKIVAVLFAIIFFGAWMLGILIDYVSYLYINLPSFIG